MARERKGGLGGNGNSGGEEGGRAPVKQSAQHDDELPEGWASAPLGDLVEMKYGKGLVQDRRRPGKVPVYGSNGVVGNHDEAVTKGPTIIVGRKGSVGEVHLSIAGCWPIDTTFFIADFGPFDYAYLTYALRAGRLGELDQSTAVPGLSREQAYAADLLIPPLAEQKRIVAKVEELLWRVKAARERLAKVPALLKRFRQSILAAACSGQLTAEWRVARGEFGQIDGDLPVSWMQRQLSEVCTAFQYGSSQKSDKEGKVPVLRMGNIQDGEIDWSDLVYSNDDVEIEKYLLEPNTVLFNRTNSPELVGKSGVYRGERPAIFAGYLIRVCAGCELEPLFLNLVMNSPTFKEYCQQVKTDGVSQSNINARKLAEYRMNWCQLPEQREIVRRVEALFALADKIEARVQASTARVEKITQAILTKAFRGELVPTEAELARQEGRDYEPATVLLERIRASQAKTGDGPSGRRPAPQRRKRAQNDRIKAGATEDGQQARTATPRTKTARQEPSRRMASRSRRPKRRRM